MTPRLDISFPLSRQWQYWFGNEYVAKDGEYLLNHARTGIVMALRASLPHGGRVGVVTYNCHTVANAVVSAGCTPVFVDVTKKLTIDIQSVPSDLDAIVVTNLFGIRNDIASIRMQCPKAVIIVDNAHGYGLPVEGDFTVYSINQGKFPALGEGGILRVKELKRERAKVMDEMYASLPTYALIAQVKLFVSMLIRALLYSRCAYWMVRKLKKKAHPDVHEKIALRQMAPGIRRLYRAALLEIPDMVEKQRKNAALMSERVKELKCECLVGENAFMLVAKTQDPEALKAWFAERGVETETHFEHCIEWAEEFEYRHRTCPMAERLTQELLMVPTYKNIKIQRTIIKK